jgi:hypothetical protein
MMSMLTVFSGNLYTVLCEIHPLMYTGRTTESWFQGPVPFPSTAGLIAEPQTVTRRRKLTDRGRYDNEAGHSHSFCIFGDSHVSLDAVESASKSLPVTFSQLNYYLSNGKRICEPFLCFKDCIRIPKTSSGPTILLVECAQACGLFSNQQTSRYEDVGLT